MWGVGAAACAAMLLYCIKGVRRALRTRTENYDEKENFCTRIKGLNLSLVAGVYDLMSDFNFYLSLSDEEQESDSGKACLVFCIISTAILSLKIFWDIFVRSVSNRLRSPPACSAHGRLFESLCGVRAAVVPAASTTVLSTKSSTAAARLASFSSKM